MAALRNTQAIARWGRGTGSAPVFGSRRGTEAVLSGIAGLRERGWKNRTPRSRVGSGQRHGERPPAAGTRRGRGLTATPPPHVVTAGARFVTSGAGQLTGSGCCPISVAWQRRRSAAMADDDLPIVSFGSLMTEGTILSRRGQHDKALGCFNDVRAPRPTAGGASGGAAATGRGWI